MPYDVRAIANLVLDIADASRVSVSNLVLNKIVYFLHVEFLHVEERPLVDAKIEAWDYGPVFREIYHQFKQNGRDRIIGRAKKLDITKGTYGIVQYSIPYRDEIIIRRTCERLFRLSASELVDLSHTEDGAWHCARYQNGRVNPGVEITNDMILAAHLNQSRH